MLELRELFLGFSDLVPQGHNSYMLPMALRLQHATNVLCKHHECKGCSIFGYTVVKYQPTKLRISMVTTIQLCIILT